MKYIIYYTQYKLKDSLPGMFNLNFPVVPKAPSITPSSPNISASVLLYMYNRYNGAPNDLPVDNVILSPMNDCIFVSLLKSPFPISVFSS